MGDDTTEPTTGPNSTEPDSDSSPSRWRVVKRHRWRKASKDQRIAERDEWRRRHFDLIHWFSAGPKLDPSIDDQWTAASADGPTEDDRKLAWSALTDANSEADDRAGRAAALSAAATLFLGLMVNAKAIDYHWVFIVGWLAVMTLIAAHNARGRSPYSSNFLGEATNADIAQGIREYRVKACWIGMGTCTAGLAIIAVLIGALLGFKDASQPTESAKERTRCSEVRHSTQRKHPEHLTRWLAKLHPDSDAKDGEDAQGHRSDEQERLEGAPSGVVVVCHTSNGSGDAG